VLTHPNGWEGQQQQVRRAVKIAGLISSKEEQSHMHLLTDGEVCQITQTKRKINLTARESLLLMLEAELSISVPTR
ncbi:hypothetical protein DEU56DRAFT_828141, partial [Suillus clintonianus]|uniref:uncharacterized protein n=1 Tax=Suillus clintonianus TaxID=1904413 RepID=UPI001B866A38